MITKIRKNTWQTIPNKYNSSWELSKGLDSKKIEFQRIKKGLTPKRKML